MTRYLLLALLLVAPMGWGEERTYAVGELAIRCEPGEAVKWVCTATAPGFRAAIEPDKTVVYLANFDRRSGEGWYAMDWEGCAVIRNGLLNTVAVIRRSDGLVFIDKRVALAGLLCVEEYR